MSLRASLVLSFLILLPLDLPAQEFDTVRVCTYNLLRFDAESHDRIDAFRAILNEIRPRILVVQELEGYDALALFGDSVAGRLDIPLAGLYFEYQPSSTVVFFDTGSFRASMWHTDLDDPELIMQCILHHYRYGLLGDSLSILDVHWREGAGHGDERGRLYNSERLRNLVTVQNQRFLGAASIDKLLVAGSLNLRSADEEGYEELTFARHYRLIDPIARSGDWHGDSAFAAIHTESTRDREFGGGEGGGLDDRYDQILLSEPLFRGLYVPGSYATFGNDGGHFGDSINAAPNHAVSPEIAQALHDASDHLPVYLDLVFPRPTLGFDSLKEDATP